MNAKPRFSLPLLAGLGLALALAFTGSAWATDYYVATTGSDSNAGTQAAPWATIAKCASAMSAGDTCYIRGGTYHEHGLNPARSGTAGSPITFAGYPGEAVTIDGDYTGSGSSTQVFFTSRSYITVQDLEIINSYYQGWYDGNGTKVSGLKALRLHIHDIYGWAGDNAAAIRWDLCTDCVIDSCELHHIVNTSSGYALDNVVMTYGAIRLEIKNSNIYDGDNLIMQKNADAGGGDGMIVHDNVLHDGRVGIRYGLQGNGSPPHHNQKAYNNVIYNIANDGIKSEVNYASGISDGLLAYNNTINAKYCFTVDGFLNQQVYNNICTVTGSGGFRLKELDGYFSQTNQITYWDYNLWSTTGTNGSWTLQANTGSAKTVSSLANWQALTSSENDLSISNPDAHGLLADPKFMDASANDYRICDDSPAIGAGRSGENIGAPTAVVDCPPAPVTGVVVRPQ
jgi:Pel9A-like, right handed beta helix region